SQRWARQLSAAPPPGASGIDPNCISICVVGDFERAVPTPTQLKRLGQLVGALQRRLGIGASDVILFESAGGPEGVGRYFPATALREQALP
ncbi:MAG: peptidoglycan recognition protein family protein, partial [Tepidisphaeraceae bacterium]